MEIFLFIRPSSIDYGRMQAVTLHEFFEYDPVPSVDYMML